MEQYELNWKNYYEVLQVSPNAEPAVIAAAYRRLAQTIARDPTMAGRLALYRMGDINEAYQVLSDPARKAAYDRAFKKQYQPEEIMIRLMRSAAEKADEGKTKSQVADELTKEGIPYDIATQVRDGVFAYRRKEGTKAIGCGLLMLIVGGLLTGLSYLAASGPQGGTYFVTIGLFIVGGLTLLTGLYKWFTS